MYFRATLFFIVLLLSNVTIAAIEQPHLKIITEEWAPYNYSVKGDAKGFSVEIVNAMMQELGEYHSIAIYPGARGMLLLDNTTNVLNFSLFRTPEREHKYKWIGPLSNEAIYFYKRADDPREFKTIEDVKAVNAIATPLNGLVFSHLQEQNFTNLSKSHSTMQQLTKLLKNRVDLSISVTPLGKTHYLKKIGQPTNAVTNTGVKLLERPLYIACSKELPDSVINRWQQALDRVIESGKYAKIYDNYLQGKQ
ncbi:MAG: amino acid ABC transporter substrate-binding protein [Psychromonas sp.]|nr:amino acid ABC transporter substrate-binding protein [Psychromonas sp.]